MDLTLFSQHQSSMGRVLRPYMLDNIQTVGGLDHEPYGIRFHNSIGAKVQVIIAVDGTNVQTGDKARLDEHQRMWVVAPYGSMELVAWPESREGGAAFMFTDRIGETVAANTHGDLGALGYVSVAIYMEGYSVQPAAWNEGRLEKSLTRGVTMGSDLGTGAGDWTQQHVGTAQGLNIPTFSKIVQLRYLPWHDLQQRLRDAGIQPIPAHPTGFETQMANLRRTPRIGRRTATATHLVYERLA